MWQYSRRVRLGVGGGAFGVRGGISTRGVGVGVGPFSAGTSWRKGGGSGSGGLIAWLILAAAVLFIVAWPYLLGTYIAVRCGAWNPSTERFVVGWCFEVVYIAALAGWFITAREKSAQRSIDETQRMAELIASGEVYETKYGRSLVYRHGTCPTNHRLFETAATCGKSVLGAEAGANVDSGEQLNATNAALVWPGAILAAGLVAGLVILLADPIHSPAEDAASKPCPATSVGATPATIAVPDTVGQNAGSIAGQLNTLGIRNVELSSANPEYKSVWVASNWTVVSTDPAPGCLVAPDGHVVVYVTK